MNLAFALVSRRAMHFSPNHSLRLYIEQNGVAVPGTLGEDRFDYNGMLLPDTPVVATGRKVLHTIQLDLVGYQGISGIPVEMASPQDGLPADMVLCLDNNLILDQGDLQTYFTLVATVDDRLVPLPLQTPLMKVDWQGKGKFRILLDGSCWGSLSA